MSWGFVAVGVGTAAGGYMGSKGAKDAAKESSKGADAASQVQWDISQQSRQDQMPWLATGNSALKKLAALNGVEYSTSNTPAGAMTSENFDSAAYLAANPDVARATTPWNGITYSEDPYQHYLDWGKGEGRQFTYVNAPGSATTGSGSTKPDYSDFYESPDYQFAFDEGNRAVNAGLAARGLSGSGRAMKELTRYGQGAASQQLNTYTNALAAMAGVGQSTATSLGQQGMQTGQIIGQNTQNSADARASGYLGSANSWGSAISNGVGAGAYMYGKKTA